MTSKKLVNKETLKPVAVLLGICIVVALLLGAINMITAPEIARKKQEAIDNSLKVVLPEGNNFQTFELNGEYPEEIKSAYKADGGYVFELDVRGKSDITLMCGVDSEGKIVGIEIISENETPGYKELVLPFVIGTEGKYAGMDSSTLEKAELESGATLTANAIYNAVKASLDAYAVAQGGELAPEPEETLPKTDEQIVSLAATLMGVEADALVNITPTDAANLRRLYKDEGGKGYAAYIVVMSTHYEGQVETETLVYIGNDAKIKGINKLQWNVSAAAPDWGYNPPSEDEVDALYNRLVGKDSSAIGEVDLATGATNTTTAMVNSVIEALDVVEELIKLDMPTPEDDIKALAATLMGVEADALVNITPTDAANLRRLYKDEGGKGYAAYIVVMSTHYEGQVETETLVYIGNDSKIKGINKLQWNVSAAAPDWGYNPPSEDEVDALYNRLVGKDSATIPSEGDAELKTGATNTSTAMVKSVSEALTAVDNYIASQRGVSYLPMIVGISIIALGILGFAAYLALPEIIRRRKIK